MCGVQGSMDRGHFNRPGIASRLLRSLVHGRHYRSMIVSMGVVRRPLSFWAGYGLGWGEYPATVEVKTPTGTLPLKVNSWHDLRTIHEIFCASDYAAKPSDKVIVDYGSNIGISAAYFLSRNTDSFIYLFEPVPQNLQLLKTNMERFAGRYSLHEVAVGLEDGQMEFGWEATGRLGGLGQKTGNYMTVEVRKSKDILNSILKIHGEIDILKIDIETLEKEITEDLPKEIAEKIKTLYVEYPFKANPLSATHHMNRFSTLSCFVRKNPERASPRKEVVASAGRK